MSRRGSRGVARGGNGEKRVEEFAIRTLNLPRVHRPQELNPALFEGSGLPVVVKAATLRRLEVSVSWLALLSAPMTVTLDGLFLCVAPGAPPTVKDRVEALLAETSACVRRAA